MSEGADIATTLLARITRGDGHAADALTPMLYEQLRALAGSLLVDERRGHSLQPTALVHEAYLRMIDQQKVDKDDRAAFFGLAATLMRRILVDHARARRRMKRGGGARRVMLRESLAPGVEPADEWSIDVEILNASLEKLAELDERKARLVELRFFGGLDEPQAAETLGISRATAARDWRFARAWLAHEIEESSGPRNRRAKGGEGD
ncbi:MAG: sigma-70 family RNA polymerase sigma factor [Phycisphaeraceae bacterium]|nr:sigma-70 family RNA polymerase sigma factor [Phycisphaeraceae bacterium]